MARSKKPSPSDSPEVADDTPDTLEGATEARETPVEPDAETADEAGGDAAPAAGQTEPLVLTEDAEPTHPAEEAADEVVDAPAEADDSTGGTEAEDSPEAGPGDEITSEESAPDAAETVEAAPPEPAPEPGTPAPAPPTPTPPPAARPSAIPLFLGGVAAAALGFVVARYAVPEGQPTPDGTPTADLSAAIDEQATRIAGLEDRLGGLSAAIDDLSARPAPAVDTAALRDEVLAAMPETPDAATLDALRARIDGLASEVAALADRPEPAAPVLTDDQIAGFRAELDAAVADARAEIEAAQAEAARIEAEASASAARAAAEAALAQVAAAIDAGSAYGDALAAITQTGVDVPAVLVAGAEGGIPTLPVLRDEFPDAARAALDASIRSAEADTAMGRAIAFLRAQTGARSLTPREGDDPDAVLSRAEAALRVGDLNAALAELAALPEAGAAAMADWTAAAETRQAALDALSELRGRVETN